jgi:hypothetical protein
VAEWLGNQAWRGTLQASVVTSVMIDATAAGEQQKRSEIKAENASLLCGLGFGI